MLWLRRNQYTIGAADLGYLVALTESALDRGETVEVQRPGDSWVRLRSTAHAEETMRRLFAEVDAQRAAEWAAPGEAS